MLIVCALTQLAAGAAHAQTARSGGAPNAQLMLQMQQLASERTSLQAENARIKKEMEDVKKERDQLKKGHEATDQRAKAGEAALAHANQQREASDQELTQTKARMQELIAKFRETVQSMRQLETEDRANKQTLAARYQELQTCVDRNLALYQLNDEVLTHIDKQGAWSQVALAEPFTRIKRVQNENLVVEYKAKAQDQRASSPGSSKLPAPAPARPGAASSSPPIADSAPAESASGK